jgi:two-component system, NarL family, invasion response regulator UvrY
MEKCMLMAMMLPIARYLPIKSPNATENRLNTKVEALVTVLLADDHPIVRAGFATSLPAYGIRVLGEVGQVDDVIECYDKLQPEVLVLDIRFGEALTGLDIAAYLMKRVPAAKIVFLSQFSQDSIIKRCYQIGGKAFLTKDCELSELADAIKQAKAGQLYFLPKVAERLANLSVLGDQSPETILQEREIQIFKLMAQGLTIVEIAESLGLSVKTISNASQNIKEKLDAHRPAEITRLAIRHGLMEA